MRQMLQWAIRHTLDQRQDGKQLMSQFIARLRELITQMEGKKQVTEPRIMFHSLTEVHL